LKAPIPTLGNSLSFLLPLLYLVLILTYDWAESFQTISPPLLSMGLLLGSLLLKPRWMILWATIYSFIVLNILLDPRIFSFFSGGNNPYETTSHKFRALGFIVTSAFACVFSWTLTRLQKKRAALHNLVQQMPVPVFISDVEGRILELNERGRQLLALEIDAPLPNFFDAFAPKLQQGKCIAAYLSLFEVGTTSESRLEIEYHGRKILAHAELITSKPRQLITMIPLGDRESEQKLSKHPE
jgi:PAS domain-containing protein